MLLANRLFAALASATVAASACSDPTGPSERLEELPRQLAVSEREVITASNDFTFRLLQQIVADPELGSDNVFLSPFSVSMALGMTMNGAVGDTYDAMRATLGFGAVEEVAINESYRDLTELLLGLDGRTELRIANSVWSREGYPFLESFYGRVRDYFGATTRELDFDAPGAEDVMNAWVSDATNGRIEAIVQEIRPDDVMFLINAVYFKGQWRNRFDPGRTRPSAFYLEGADDPVQVQTMHAEKSMGVGLGGTGFSSGSGIEVGELPYGNGAFNMVVTMPARDGSIDDLVASLDAETWQQWMDDIAYVEDATVSLPKWEMEYEVPLEGPLTDMGMGIAFGGAADFTRLSPAGGLSISRVRHKTFLKVDEEGTEAAAATSVAIQESLGPHIIVDRPFLVAIRERLSGAILFIGVVRDPR